MAIRTMCKMGDPVLRSKAKPVVELDVDLHKLLDDMADSMAYYNGIGLAAPQIGVGQSVVVIKIDDNFPIIEMINPEITQCTGEEIDVEGCLSVPGVYGEVKRCSEVTVKYQDRHGKNKELNGTGLLARAIQHEVDHLQGVLFIDKVIKYVSEDE